AALAACGDGGSEARELDAGQFADAASLDAEIPPTSAEPPNYEAAFPADRVVKLEIVIAPEDYARMQADMTDILGQRGMSGGAGSFGGAGFMIPDAVLQACMGREAGASCEGSFGAMSFSGKCAALGGRSLCLPEGVGGIGGMGGMGFGQGSVDLVPRTPAYVPAAIHVDGEVWKHAGIRYKGNSSLATSWRSGSPKLPLRLKFDEFEDIHPETRNQRYHGFQSLSLSNAQEDPTLIRSKLAKDVFARAGLPTPASAFYRVYLDHGEGLEYRGLYTASELPQDDAFLEATFGADHGNLYKPSGASARFEQYDESGLEKENNEDEHDFGDVRALHAALHADRADPARWRAELERTFNVDVFLRWLALNTVVQDWDSYGRMPHNYYLYADPGDAGRLTWIAWDQSYAMAAGGGFAGSPLSLGLSEVTAQWPLIRFLLDDQVYRASYRSHVAETIEQAFTVADMEERIRAARALTEPYIFGPDGEGANMGRTPEAYEASYQQLLAHAASRAEAVRAFLASD
ncbi:MAG TPA: CotH kinase family protein, partial [Polyangiales bacterium]